ncbi:unnamed protein product [Triticum turgidum subsp. durum]|uniref:Protein BZR1 homolog n=1 Tax=Triticum turgidum subsp. durum TaxID=4567 RepID=A0A9R0YTY5_TRITD|nr:unnamed protein product [Triticum turgidum subsp. durum]
MASRVPTWRERENNRRRERRRRAVAANIFHGLRARGGYALPKHCDNNEVLKALCDEAGWTVEPDGTTYRKGCMPPAAAEGANPVVRSGSRSPCSSHQVSPRAPYNPRAGPSTFPTSGTSSHTTLGGGSSYYEGSSFIPWLKNLSSGSGFASSSKFPRYSPHSYDYFSGGSISAPVTPPSGSPRRMPHLNTGWGEYPSVQVQPPWFSAGGSAYDDYASLPNSTPSSPRGGHGVGPDPAWLSGFQISSAGPSSPTYSLMAPSNPFRVSGEMAAATASSSRMRTPCQSGTCSPVALAAHGDVQMEHREADDFAFGSGGRPVLVNAWEGERIHEVCASDEHELDLTLGLGSSKTRAGAVN